MKAFIYMAFIVAFIIIFQQNPLFGVILILIFGGGYLYFKSRKHRGGSALFRSGRNFVSNDQTQQLLTYMLLQQLSNPNNISSHHHEYDIKPKESIDENDKARQEILRLLEKVS